MELKLEILKDETTRGGGHTEFRVVADFPITNLLCRELQTASGRHPAGYDFCSFNVVQQPSKMYVATWFCYANCD